MAVKDDAWAILPELEFRVFVARVILYNEEMIGALGVA